MTWENSWRSVLERLRPLIGGKLAVGPGNVSLNMLKNEGITAIVDLNQDIEEMRLVGEAGMKYSIDSKLRIEDNFEPIPINVLEHVVKVVDSLISEGHYVYLHCSASRGRSPTIAAAYLIYLGRSKNEAMDEVRKVRTMAWLGIDGNYAAFLERARAEERVFRKIATRREQIAEEIAVITEQLLHDVKPFRLKPDLRRRSRSCRHGKNTVEGGESRDAC